MSAGFPSTVFPTIFHVLQRQILSALPHYTSLSKKDIHCPKMTLIVRDRLTLGKKKMQPEKKNARKGSEREVEASNYIRLEW
jgi:hypothetical protein